MTMLKSHLSIENLIFDTYKILNNFNNKNTYLILSFGVLCLKII